MRAPEQCVCGGPLHVTWVRDGEEAYTTSVCVDPGHARHESAVNRAFCALLHPHAGEEEARG